jgi:hypothetical protein
LALILIIARSASQLRRVPLDPLASGLHDPDFALVTLNRSLAAIDCIVPLTAPMDTNTPLGLDLYHHALLVSIILSSPQEAILRGAQCVATTEQHVTDSTNGLVKRWMQEDSGRTARRVVVYAARLLGSLAEKRSMGWYAPVMVLTATVVLWTWAELGPAGDGGANNSRSVSSVDSDDADGTERDIIIRLDVTDQGGLSESSLVQEWIEGREGVRAHIRDVGVVDRPGAPGRMLNLGLKVLGDMAPTGLAKLLSGWLANLRERVEDG